MGYKIGIDKKQISFMPMCLDDIIEENHIGMKHAEILK